MLMPLRMWYLSIFHLMNEYEKSYKVSSYLFLKEKSRDSREFQLFCMENQSHHLIMLHVPDEHGQI